MFLNTLCIGKSTVWGWKQSRSFVNQAVSLVELPKARENLFHIEVASLKDFFESLQKLNRTTVANQHLRNKFYPNGLQKNPFIIFMCLNGVYRTRLRICL